ncbi:hypothetical protein OE88DRAFT_1664154 [Heliocybe sulcata]|uniref:DNA polymerase delta subunit 4 n=1 Tax=Heliocybe sulcata TaxID=5364 RepID=A0A5C3MTP0_9AGAM|nr:hypothetical protein OE88DRAFT_1664154 [Heliocybe sulcata]
MPVTRSNSKNASQSLKQARLSFTSARRTASNATSKKPAASRATSTSSIQRPLEDSDNESSGSDVEQVVLSRTWKRNGRGVEDGLARLNIVEDSVPADREVLDLQDKKGRWRKHYGAVRQKMGNLEPIHAKGQTKIHHILRVFDLSYEYGPCIGVTRLERWERAQALGLNPPPEVREILLTKQGQEEDQFRETAFYGEA